MSQSIGAEPSNVQIFVIFHNTTGFGWIPSQFVPMFTYYGVNDKFPKLLQGADNRNVVYEYRLHNYNPMY
jgi:hypothetical protein